MLYVVTALYCEAKPWIQTFSLKKNVTSQRFQLFQNDNICTIDTDSELLSAFPADGYTTPPWYQLLCHAHCEPVPANAELAAEMIDHWARMERLGLIWREGSAVFCTVRLWEAADEPAAGWLALSLGRAALAASREEENKP